MFLIALGILIGKKAQIFAKLKNEMRELLRVEWDYDEKLHPKWRPCEQTTRNKEKWGVWGLTENKLMTKEKENNSRLDKIRIRFY